MILSYLDKNFKTQLEAQNKLSDISDNQIKKSIALKTQNIEDVISGPAWNAQVKSIDFVKKNTGTGGGYRI